MTNPNQAQTHSLPPLLERELEALHTPEEQSFELVFPQTGETVLRKLERDYRTESGFTVREGTLIEDSVEIVYRAVYTAVSNQWAFECRCASADQNVWVIADPRSPKYWVEMLQSA